MKKLAAISPRTTGMMAQSQSGTPEEQEYSRLFTDMAYSVFEGRSPELAPRVVTFKVLETNLESGSAAGAFLVDIEGTRIHVPILLSGGRVKSPEMFYLKEVDGFLPLTQEWLKEIPKLAPPELGAPTATPSTLSGDLDIRAITQPPSTGRNVYASVGGLPEILSNAPNSVKLAWSNFLQEDTETLKVAYRQYGKSLVDALERHPENSTKVASSGQVSVLTPASSAEAFSAAFGSAAGVAYKTARRDGIVIRDTRKTASVPVETGGDALAGKIEPKLSGLYKLIRRTGEPTVALVVRRPFNIHSGLSHEYLALLPNGDFFLTNELVALQTSEELPEGKLKSALGGNAGLSNGHKIFLKPGDTPSAIAPMHVSAAAGATAKGDETTLLSYVSGQPMKSPHRPKGSNQVFIPDAFVSMEAGERLDKSEFLLDPLVLQEHIDEGVAKLSTASLRVKNSGAGHYAVDGEPSQDVRGTVLKLAERGLNAVVAHKFLADIDPGYSKVAKIVPAENLLKLSSIFGPSAAPQMAAPQMAAPQMAAPPMGAPPMGAPQMGAPQMGAPQMGAPQMGAPQMGAPAMQAAAAAESPELFDAAAVATALQSPELASLTASYLPDLEKALDSSGRILLGIQMNENTLTGKLGVEQYTSLESNLKKVFTGLGTLVLSLHERVGMVSGPSLGEEAGLGLV